MFTTYSKSSFQKLLIQLFTTVIILFTNSHESQNIITLRLGHTLGAVMRHEIGSSSPREKLTFQNYHDESIMLHAASLNLPR